MKQPLFLIPAFFLLISIANLPIGYYTFLRIIVTIGAVFVIISEFENSINFWFIVFGLVVILFNPLIPVYINNKEAWIPIDIIAAVLFIIKSFNINLNKTKNE